MTFEVGDRVYCLVNSFGTNTKDKVGTITYIGEGYTKRGKVYKVIFDEKILWMGNPANYQYLFYEEEIIHLKDFFGEDNYDEMLKKIEKAKELSRIEHIEVDPFGEEIW